MKRENLHTYQERAISFIKDKKKCALLLEMGLGKTISTLTAMSDLIDGMGVTKVLIIAPLRVAKSVWHTEVDKWEHLSGLKCVKVLGCDSARREAMTQEGNIYLINRENTKWLVDNYYEKWPFDGLIIDESSSFKSHSSQRFRAIRRVASKFNYITLLTGTPSPNGLIDLWSQLYIIDSGERLGRTMRTYKSAYFNLGGYLNKEITVKKGASDRIYKKINDVVLSMRADDYLELPNRIDITKTVILEDKVMNEYVYFRKNLLLDLDSKMIEAANATSLAGKLLQFANGAVYHGDKKEYVEVHSEKIEALDEIIEDNKGENILVAYNFKSDLARLKSKYPKAKVLKDNMNLIDKWNNKEVPLMFAHPASCGHGLNLQGGGSIVVWFGLNWSLELYQQFNARLHRQGQEKPVKIIHIVCENTIDERIIKILNNKNATQSDLMSSLK